MRRSFVIGPMMGLALFVGACAGYKKPGVIDDAHVRQRAQIQEKNGIRVAVAVIGTAEAREIFGIDFSPKNMQAVWIEIENNADRPITLLPTGMDPDYFAPLEVSYAYHKWFSAEANASLDDHILSLNFPIRTPILPGSKISGYVFRHWSKGGQIIDVDLMGRKVSYNFTFFASNPDGEVLPNFAKHMAALYSASELKHVQTEATLRQALEQLPCCVSAENGAATGEPLNVVFIGNMDDWVSGFVRRRYNYQELSPRYVFGRIQDISGQKKNRGYTRSQAQTIRIWQTPIRYKGLRVWIAQIAVRAGGRFADKAPAEVTLPLDPYVDQARIDLLQDLAYSQVLIKAGHVKISELKQASRAESSTKDPVHYITDGLRAVLVFGPRPASLGEIEFFDWERLTDYR